MRAADDGPPGMGSAWRVYRLLPALYALRGSASEAAWVVRSFNAEDVTKLRKASPSVRWDMPPVDNYPATSGDPVPANTKLADVAQVILNVFAVK